MKKITLVIIAVILTISISQAQILTFSASVGDGEMDNVLIEVQNRAVNDIASFKVDVNASFAIPLPKIELALKVMSPGDIFMAAQLSLSINKPFDDVVKTYQANKTKGWGVIAKEMGIKPGSPEFHAMKNSMKSKGKGNSGGKGNGGGNGNGKKGNGQGKKK